MAKKTLQYAQALGNDSTDKRLDILRRIGELGSISEAARSAGVSYKGAWQAIYTLSNLAGLPLLERNVGGSGGGGALLTDAGRQLIAAAEQLSAAKARVLADWEGSKQVGSGVAAGNLGALGLRTSMRNQFPCAVLDLKKVGGAARVRLQLAGAVPLCSRVTLESAELLALKPGLPVLALCKATAVQVAKAADSAAGRNLVRGVVTRASRAAAGGEVALQLEGGLQLVGFSAAHIGLKTGDVAFACFDESAVVIALA